PDQWLDYALWLTIREQEPVWMPALKRGEIPFRDIKHLIFALQSVDAGGAAPTIVSLLKSGSVKMADETELLVLLAEAGGADELAIVFDRALAAAGTRPRLLAALDDAARRRKVKPAGDLTRLAPLLAPKHEDLTKPGTKLGEKDDATRVAAARLVGAWKLEMLLS